MFHWMERDVLPCNLENDVIEFKPCSACYNNKNISNNNNNNNKQIFKQDKPISTNVAVIKGGPVKAKK